MLGKDFKEVRQSLQKILRESNPDSDLFLIKKCLLENISFQLPATAANDRLIGLREWYRNSKKIFSSHNATMDSNSSGRSAVLGGFMRQSEAIRNYIEFESGEKLRWYFGKAEWPEMPNVPKVSYWLKWSLACMPFVWKSFFSTNRVNWALLIREVNDTTVFMYWLRKRDVQRLYDFLPYELESNWISLLCRQRGIETIKIPSSGPLATHNSILIADKIVVSSPYHLEELDIFKHSIRYKSLLKWGPERAMTYIDRYRFDKPTPHDSVIGFYSHASWLRLAQDHADVGLNIPEAEEKLLGDLFRYVQENKEFKLRIFLHPREKAEDMMEATKLYYNQKLGEGNYEFSDFHKSTTACFEDAGIAMAAFSTILFERLFSGYKTLIGNYGIPSFPLKGSDLNNICFSNYDRLCFLIETAKMESEAEFFKRNKLEDYLWSSYPSWQIES
jgi:hypothetical protein